MKSNKAIMIIYELLHGRSVLKFTSIQQSQSWIACDATLHVRVSHGPTYSSTVTGDRRSLYSSCYFYSKIPQVVYLDCYNLVPVLSIDIHSSMRWDWSNNLQPILWEGHMCTDWLIRPWWNSSVWHFVVSLAFNHETALYIRTWRDNWFSTFVVIRTTLWMHLVTLLQLISKCQLLL